MLLNYFTDMHQFRKKKVRNRLVKVLDCWALFPLANLTVIECFFHSYFIYPSIQVEMLYLFHPIKTHRLEIYLKTQNHMSTYPPLYEWTGRIMTLVVGAGTLLLLHQLSVSVVVACATQFQILLLHRVSWYLLDGQPVQRLLSRGRTRWGGGEIHKSSHFIWSRLRSNGQRHKANCWVYSNYQHLYRSPFIHWWPQTGIYSSVPWSYLLYLPTFSFQILHFPPQHYHLQRQLSFTSKI